jgi:hypothetical protein
MRLEPLALLCLNARLDYTVSSKPRIVRLFISRKRVGLVDASTFYEVPIFHFLSSRPTLAACLHDANISLATDSGCI